MIGYLIHILSTLGNLLTCVKFACVQNFDYICENTIHKMNNRLKQFLLAENISQSQFADTIGVARASISHILSGRNKPGFEFFTSIARHYPTLNLTWLITGKGRMYGNSQQRDNFIAVPSAATADEPDNPEDDETSSGEDNLFSSITPQDGTGSNDVTETESVSRISGAKSGSEPGPSARFTQAYTPPAAKRITKVVVFYDDNTYQEIK